VKELLDARLPHEPGDVGQAPVADEGAVLDAERLRRLGGKVATGRRDALYSPSWVPVIVERQKTLSPSAISSSTLTCRSGNATKYEKQPRLTGSIICSLAQ